jgi:hypothetical protein
MPTNMNEPSPDDRASGIFTDFKTAAAIAVLMALGLVCLGVGAIYLGLLPSD